MTLRHTIIVAIFFNTAIGFAQKDIFDLARFGAINDIEALMKINIDTINSVNDMGYIPLTLACYSGNENVAIFLAKHTKNINHNQNNGTALMAAVFRNRLAVAELLLQRGANPNLSDANGTTPLHYAVIAQNKELIALLIEYKAEKYTMDNKGKSAFDYALMSKNNEIISIFDKK